MSDGNEHDGVEQEAARSEDKRCVSLEADLTDYYAQQQVNVENLSSHNAPLLRFIRLNPRYNEQETLSLLAVSTHLLIDRCAYHLWI